MPSQNECAYAAGFFDGEGCISIVKSTNKFGRLRYHLRISLSQNDPAPIHWLVSHFGGTCNPKTGRCSYSTAYYHRYDWVISTRAAMTFLRAVRPHLIVKASQADLAFEFDTTIISNRRLTPDHIQELRETLYLAIRGEKHAFKITKAA